MPSPKKQTDVTAFMALLDHPYKEGIERLRAAIMALDSTMVEEIKWNAPSFRLEDHFATFKLHPPTNIQIVLHRGAKPKPVDKTYALTDTHGLLKWAAADRCVITLASSEQARQLELEVAAIVRQWIAQL